MIDPSAPHIVSRDEWLLARRELLIREKAATRQLDEVAAARRALPWVRVTQPYTFETIDGPQTLADLFGRCSQLLVYHFMFGPDWEEGCKSCSFMMDHLQGPARHVRYHDLSLVAVSRAPISRIEAFRERMGWSLPWVSSLESSFNFDYRVSFTPAQRAEGGEYNFTFTPPEQMYDELPGISVFARNSAGEIFHTYSAYARGLDLVLGTHHLFDFTPQGRQEKPGEPMAWLRHHDRYETASA